MADLSTTYLGLPLANPLVMAASSATARVENLQLAERFGAGAVVLRSLFEEQILAEQAQLEDTLSQGSEAHVEAQDYFPPVVHADAASYLRMVEQARRTVSMPLIGSINAVRSGSWTRYAKQLSECGVDAIELNVYSVAADPATSGQVIEEQLFDLVSSVLDQVSVPVAVKLSPYYTSVVNVVHELDKRGVSGVVLFNRFLQPDIDLHHETLSTVMPLSTPQEMRLPLRFTALLSGRIEADIAISTGVHTGEDMLRGLLAGATVTQVAAAVIKNGLHHVGSMLRDCEAWMDDRGYSMVDDIRGMLSQAAVQDPHAFERAQYVSMLSGGSHSSPLNARVS
ncbi:MAG: dihydroorotate dehydrogenase-like protein [Planctomycetota bacterium]|nr:MAG: dihydroorotate dehydrogenase-like protein [Planctomycetota bacterium]